jgi:glycosyltransferase involved in cell wall biosynthesis
MKLSVLNVGYPLARIGPDEVGGAEQILSALDRGLVESGHTSFVVGIEGSDIAGTLVPIPQPKMPFDARAIALARQYCRAAIEETVRTRSIDVVHMHGFDFHEYLPSAGPAVLATLHLPASWYPKQGLNVQRPRTWLNCVSRSQHESIGANAHLLPPIPNGTAMDAIPFATRKRSFVLVLGRICPEKGIHIALDVAAMARAPLILAGHVFPYGEHQDYFEQMVKPRLGFSRRYIGPVGQKRKRALLAAARCLLVTSLVAETSSLVALEALAAGTPVVAFGKGALPEFIEHGRTGFLAWNTRELVDGIRAAASIDPEHCRLVARERFALSSMIERYLALYRALAQGQSPAPFLTAAA